MPELAQAKGSCGTSAQPTQRDTNLSLLANETVEMEMSLLAVLVLCFCSTLAFHKVLVYVLGFQIVEYKNSSAIFLCE